MIKLKKNSLFFLLAIAIVFGCSSNKNTIKDVIKPSVIFEFKGYKPSLFKKLEKDLEKRFKKNKIVTGFNYNFKIPESDNKDYLDLPNYSYKTVFDYRFTISLIKHVNHPYYRKERETNTDYIYNISVYNKNEILVKNKILKTNQSYIGNYNTPELSKQILNIYKGL